MTGWRMNRKRKRWPGRSSRSCQTRSRTSAEKPYVVAPATRNAIISPTTKPDMKTLEFDAVSLIALIYLRAPPLSIGAAVMSLEEGSC